MSQLTDELMKQLQFIGKGRKFFLSQKKMHLTGQQRVLAILGAEDGMIQSYLAEILDLRPSSLAELLKKMEYSGDITRKEEETDKRIKRIYLTAEGRKKAEKITARKKENTSEVFFAGLDETEQHQFNEYLKKIAAGWDSDLQKQSERFFDPMDRLQAMQKHRRHYMEQFGADWQNMSEDERKKAKKAMKEEFRNKAFASGFDNDFPSRSSFGREFHKDIHHDKHCRKGHPRHGHPQDFSRDDWEDF